MDLNQFKQAREDFLAANRTRSDEDINGRKNTYSNLSKLYFRWAQKTAQKNPDSKRASQRLALSKNILPNIRLC